MEGRWVVRVSRRYSEQVLVGYCSLVEGGHIGYTAVEEEAAGKHIGAAAAEVVGNRRSLAEGNGLDSRCRMAVVDNKSFGIAAAVVAAYRNDQRCNPDIPTCQDLNVVDSEVVYRLTEWRRSCWCLRRASAWGGDVLAWCCAVVGVTS